MQDEIADRDDVQILAFNTGRDDAGTVSSFFEKEGYSFTAVLDVDGERGANARAFGIMASPTNIVVGPDGKVRYASTGFDEHTIRKHMGLR